MRQRTNCLECGQPLPTADAEFRIGDAEFYPDRCAAYWKGRRVSLTPQQFRVAYAIAKQSPRTVSRASAHLFTVAAEDPMVTFSVVLCRMKKAYREIDPGFDQIVNVWGKGWYWRPQDV